MKTDKELLKELQDILNEDIYWSMTDDHRRYMKYSTIWRESRRLEAKIKEEEAKSS